MTIEPAERVRSAHGATIVPEGVLGDPDLVLVPGGGWNDRSGVGAYAEARRGVITKALADRHANGRRIGSVCTGAMLLAEAGLLTGRPAITHHSAIEDLRGFGADVREGVRVVDDGDIITAAGVTSGIDLALHLIRRGRDRVGARPRVIRVRGTRLACARAPRAGITIVRFASDRVIERWSQADLLGAVAAPA
jgi:transcriptional regulator GlxA family with amidase domain